MSKKDKVLDGKCLYTPGGAAREYAAIGCNFYRGCPYQCKYCYNRKGLTAKVMGVDHAVLEDEFTKVKNRPKKYRHLSGEEYANTVFTRELDKNVEYLRNTGIFYSFSTDPMCPDACELTLSTALYAISKGVPVRILTKNASWTKEVFDRIASFTAEQKRLIAFGFTLTGCDDWEPYASPNVERIELMRTLHDFGFKTFASIEPVIDWEKSCQMIVRTIGFCDLYLIGTISHFGDFYKSGSGTTFIANKCLRNIYSLQQLFNLKIYFKESIRKYIPETMTFLYGDGTETTVSPVPMDYDIFHEAMTDPLEDIIHSLKYLNRHNAFLQGYEYKTEFQKESDIFLLWIFFMKYGNTSQLAEYVESIDDSQKERVYNEFKTLLSNAKTFLDFLNMLGRDKKVMYETDKGKANILPWLIIYAEELIEISNDVINEYQKIN